MKRITKAIGIGLLTAIPFLVNWLYNQPSKQEKEVIQKIAQYYAKQNSFANLRHANGNVVVKKYEETQNFLNQDICTTYAREFQFFIGVEPNLKSLLSEQIGDLYDAAQYAKDSRDYKRAIDLFTKRGEYVAAAETAEESGDLDLAVELYAKSPNLYKAFDIAMRIGKEAAAREYLIEAADRFITNENGGNYKSLILFGNEEDAEVDVECKGLDINFCDLNKMFDSLGMEKEKLEFVQKLLDITYGKMDDGGILDVSLMKNALAMRGEEEISHHTGIYQEALRRLQKQDQTEENLMNIAEILENIDPMAAIDAYKDIKRMDLALHVAFEIEDPKLAIEICKGIRSDIPLKLERSSPQSAKNNTFAYANTCVSIAGVAKEAGMEEDALPLLEQIIEYELESGESITYIIEELKNYGFQVEQFKELAEESKNQAITSGNYYDAGYIANQLGSTEEAVEYFQKGGYYRNAIEVLQKSGAAKERINNLVNEGINYNINLANNSNPSMHIGDITELLKIGGEYNGRVINFLINNDAYEQAIDCIQETGNEQFIQALNKEIKNIREGYVYILVQCYPDLKGILN